MRGPSDRRSSPAEQKGFELAELTLEAIQEKLGDRFVRGQVFRGDLQATIRADAIRSVCESLRDDLDWQFKFLSDLSCVDYLPHEPRFVIHYQLKSIANRLRLTLRAELPGNSPDIDSVVSVWSTANWLEREVFDLFGVVFRDHPDLRRIVLPDDFEGYPLRRDHPTGKTRINF